MARNPLNASRRASVPATDPSPNARGNTNTASGSYRESTASMSPELTASATNRPQSSGAFALGTDTSCAGDRLTLTTVGAAFNSAQPSSRLSFTTTVFSQRSTGWFDARPRRPTPEGQQAFIARSTAYYRRGLPLLQSVRWRRPVALARVRVATGR